MIRFWRLWRCWKRGSWPLLQRLVAARHAPTWQRPSPWESPLRSNRPSWQLSSARFICLICEAPAFRYGVLGLLAAVGLLFLPDTLLRALWGLPLLFGTTTSEPPPFGWSRLDPQSDTPKLVNTLNDRLGRLQQTLKLGLQWTTSTYNAGSYKRGTTGVTADDNATAVNSCSFAAHTAGIKYMFVPQSLLPYTADKVTFYTDVHAFREGGDPSVYDIKAYGASLDGKTLDTAAIQATLTQAQGQGLVFHPGGTALVSPTYVNSAQVCLAIPSNTVFRGVEWLSVLKLASNVNAETYMMLNQGAADGKTGAARRNTNITIANLVLDGNGANQVFPAGTGSRGIAFWPVQDFSITHMWVRNFGAAAATERFGLYIDGDTQGNDTTLSTVEGLIENCWCQNTQSGIGAQNLTNLRIATCYLQSCRTYQGVAISSTVAGMNAIAVTGCIATDCDDGFHVENASVSLTGNHSFGNQNNGIRLAVGAAGCTVTGNVCFNNNQAAHASPQGLGILLDETGNIPSDNVVTGNRCFDSQGVPTQNYGVGQTVNCAGHNNLFRNNQCRGNKAGNNVNVLSLTQQANVTARYNLTNAFATVTGLSITETFDTSVVVSITVSLSVDWTLGTNPGNVGDICQFKIVIDAGDQVFGNVACVVASAGKSQPSLLWQVALAAGGHTISVQALNTAGARGAIIAGQLQVSSVSNVD